jgi:hypothetical protein
MLTIFQLFAVRSEASVLRMCEVRASSTHLSFANADVVTVTVSVIVIVCVCVCMYVRGACVVHPPFANADVVIVCVCVYVCVCMCEVHASLPYLAHLFIYDLVC